MIKKNCFSGQITIWISNISSRWRLRAWRILCRLVAPASQRARLALTVIPFPVRVLISASQSWSMQTTWLLIMSPAFSKPRKHAIYLRKTYFTSSVFLNLDFIIEAQIQSPKAAHSTFSLIKNAFSFIHRLHGCNNISVQNCHC